MKMLRRHLTEEPCTLRLFVNDVKPRRSDDTAERYQEPEGNGYAPIALDSERWSFVALEEDSPVLAVYPEQLLTFTGPESAVYGFMIVAASGAVKMVERLPGDSITINRGGDIVAVVPRLSLE
jgi:hypothetical protein